MAQFNKLPSKSQSSTPTLNPPLGTSRPKYRYEPDPPVVFARRPSLAAIPMHQVREILPPNPSQSTSRFKPAPIIRTSPNDGKPQPSNLGSATGVKGEDYDPNLEGFTRINRPPAVTATGTPVRRASLIKRRSGGPQQKRHGKGSGTLAAQSTSKKRKGEPAAGPSNFPWIGAGTVAGSLSQATSGVAFAEGASVAHLRGFQQPEIKQNNAIPSAPPPPRKILDISLPEDVTSDMEIDEIDAFPGDLLPNVPKSGTHAREDPLRRLQSFMDAAFATPAPREEPFIVPAGMGIRYPKPTSGFTPPSAPRVTPQEPLRRGNLTDSANSSSSISISASTSTDSVYSSQPLTDRIRDLRALETVTDTLKRPLELLPYSDGASPAKRRRRSVEANAPLSDAIHSVPNNSTVSNDLGRVGEPLERWGSDDCKIDQTMPADSIEESSWKPTEQSQTSQTATSTHAPFRADNKPTETISQETTAMADHAPKPPSPPIAPRHLSPTDDDEEIIGVIPIPLVKEEPSSPRLAVSIDVDAPPLSLYEQLGLPQRTSGALRVPNPRFGQHETMQKQRWSKNIAESIRWVRGRENGVSPLIIGNIFWRSDGVSFDWEVPPEELATHSADFSNPSLSDGVANLLKAGQTQLALQSTVPTPQTPERQTLIQQPAPVQNGSDILIPPPARSEDTPLVTVKEEVPETALSHFNRSPAVIVVCPYSTPNPQSANSQPYSSLSTRELPHTPSLLAIPPLQPTNPAFEFPDALSNIATCFLDRYTRCFDHLKSRAKLAEAYTTDAFMSIQFNDLPSEGSCPRVGQPRKQSHAIVDYADRELGRNLLLDADRDPKHREHNWRTKTSLSIGSQAIALRLAVFEEFLHTPFPSSSRTYRFVVTPLKELGLLVLEYSGELYAIKSESKQRQVSLRFQRTFVMTPNEPDADSWIDWPWLITNDQMTLFHRPGVLCQCPA